jgi:hypothetical protein
MGFARQANLQGKPWQQKRINRSSKKHQVRARNPTSPITRPFAPISAGKKPQQNSAGQTATSTWRASRSTAMSRLGNGNTTAIRWLGVDDSKIDISYAELQKQTNRFANALASLGYRARRESFCTVGSPAGSLCFCARKPAPRRSVLFFILRFWSRPDRDTHDDRQSEGARHHRRSL